MNQSKKNLEEKKEKIGRREKKKINNESEKGFTCFYSSIF